MKEKLKKYIEYFEDYYSSYITDGDKSLMSYYQGRLDLLTEIKVAFELDVDI